jgi:tetratricopeptide (TPR) repeat protein
MAHVMGKEPQRAVEVLDALIRDDPNASAYYARALANFALKRKPEATADIEAARRMGLDNPNVRDWQARIAAMP